LKKRVVVLGDVMLDVVTRPAGPVAPTSDTPARTRIGRGGSGANIAVALAHGAHEVYYVGAVGDDAPGQMIEDDLRAAGVIPLLERVDAPTGIVVAVVAPDGQRSMLSDRGANSALSLEHVARVFERPLDHLHVSGYTLLDDATRRVGVAALGLARSGSVATSVDVCSVAPLLRVTPAVFLWSVEASAMLFANEEEAMALSTTGDVAQALNVLSSLFEEVVVTRGAHGGTVRRGRDSWQEPSRASDVVDTTGAGDAATGAYLASRLDGEIESVALVRAMDASSRVVRELGSGSSAGV
jgi:ribokinase